MDGPGLPPKLLSTLSCAADTVRRHHFIHLYSHFDGDGMTSMTIVARALSREGIGFSTTNFPVLSDEQMDVIRSDGAECRIITDLGASYIEQIEKLDGDSIVLDHHELGFTDTVRTVYANPHMYGVDGGKDTCAATMALLFAITLNPRNWDLSSLALAGMVGDMQTKNGVHEFNEYVVSEGIRRGFIKATPGSLVPDGDLVSSLSHSTIPYIRGVSNSLSGTKSLLKEAGIEPGTTYADLDDEHRQILSSLITVRLVKQGVTLEKMTELVHDRYFLPAFGLDAGTLSDVLDSCGRNEQADVGIAAGMGDREALKEASEIHTGYKEPLLDAIKLADGTLNQMDNIQWTDTSEFGFSGAIASIVVGYIGKPNKPAITINMKDESAKVSSRGTDTLISRGLDLSVAMREACAAAGGEGGGHKIASGGQFPSENYETFLKTADRIIGEQLKNA